MFDSFVTAINVVNAIDQGVALGEVESAMPHVAAEICRSLAVEHQSLAIARRFFLHQANLGMNQLVLKRLVGREVGDDIAPIILSEYANTASAGSIIAFHLHRDDIQSGEAGVICSFGAGYSIGSVVVRRR